MQNYAKAMSRILTGTLNRIFHLTMQKLYKSNFAKGFNKLQKFVIMTPNDVIPNMK